MTVGFRRPVSLSLRFKLLLLITGPLLVALGFALGALGGLGSAAAVDPVSRAERIARWFEETLRDSSSIAEATLRSRSGAAPAGDPSSALGARLEGVAVLDSRLDFLDWHGRPAEPPWRFAESDAPEWRVRSDGVHTRLFSRAGPDADRHVGLASFVLDSKLDRLAFERLVPDDLLRGVELCVGFRDPLDRVPIDASALLEAGRRTGCPDGAHLFVLATPSGDALATAALLPNPVEHGRSRLRAAGRAYSALLLLALAGLLFDWREIVTRGRGFAVFCGVVLLARFALVRVDATSVLLPRELGTASLFGSAAAWGLFASPADLLLTALALYLFSLAACSWLGSLRARVRTWLATGAGAGVAVVAFSLTASAAHNSRVPVLDQPGLLRWSGSTLVTLGLILIMLGGAELFGIAWVSIRGEQLAGGRAGRVPVALAFLVLAVASSIGLQRLSERLAQERLRAGLAPQILGQSVQRRLALSAAVRQVHDYYLQNGLEGRVAELPPDALAYHFWVTGELFHGGYKSSLEFYNSSGDRVSHFGFDLPPLDEELRPPEYGADTAELFVTSEEFTPTPAVHRRLLHAEMPVVHNGELLGVVVGHVLDEPDNLSFLPWSQPYLAALGPGSPRSLGADLGGGPDYVLYDSRGRVGLRTMNQPPPLTASMARAADEQGAVRVRAGDEAYAGVAVRDDGEVHLLLVRVRGLLERLAGSARLAGAGLILLALLSLAPRLLRPRGVADLVGALRGSFYRKLLAAVLVASVLPLVGLALFLRGYVERRADAALNDSAIRIVGAAQRALEDYAASPFEVVETDALAFNDNVLYWLRRVVGQEIHVYDGGLLLASSKRELFASGLLPPRLDGDVYRELVDDGVPYRIVPTAMGSRRIPVAYAQVFEHDPDSRLVVAVPMISAEQQIERDVDRVAEMLLLATMLLVGLLAVAATTLARTVARPVRELAEATRRISAGNYDTRLRPRTGDEVADLVEGFNSMAASLAEQRADLERRKDYMETLLRHATTGVISTDPRGRLVTLNPAGRELLAAASRSLREGAALEEALSGEDELRPLAEFLGTRSRHGEAEEIDLEVDGQPRRFRVVRVELPDSSGHGTVGNLILLDDVTELMRSNQLAAWAEMARAIAHEIKNPLTPIQLSTEHLQRLLRDRGVLPSPPLEACLQTVIKQVRTLHEIAGTFSAYAKLPELAPRPADPVAFMQEAVEPYRVSPPPGVTVVEDYEPSGRVNIDAKVLTRAVINLVENALAAMPGGGRLRFAVSSDGGRSVVLSVGDTGKGLEAEARRRLFEPYFSTKSSGTGLGLAIVRRVVEAHHGSIDFDSEADRGTTFRIVLPAVS